MDNDTAPSFQRLEEMRPSRRPRIGLMGEFSAGKSTLSNLLVGGNALPVQVTATQLPPVWISQGNDSPFMVDVADKRHEVDIENLVDVDVESTKYLRFFRDADLLEMCDLIDMPGISDPNMSSAVWERVLPFVDMVIWCTHSTQAWRQSEAAVWSSVSPKLQEKSLLLLTRMDKVLGDRDRERVLKRVRRETAGLFGAVFPISLTEAIAAGEDRAKWDRSGAEAFTTYLVEALMSFQGDEGRARLARAASRPPVSEGSGLHVRKGPDPDRVIPKRVAPQAITPQMHSKPQAAAIPKPRGKEPPLRLY